MLKTLGNYGPLVAILGGITLGMPQMAISRWKIEK
jgi:hypothetical protein